MRERVVGNANGEAERPQFEDNYMVELRALNWAPAN